MTKSPGSKKQDIIISPLNWGLGHASRMVPVVQAFLDLGCNVTIVSDGLPLKMLQGEFGQRVSFHEFPGAGIRYSRGKSQLWKIIIQLPSLVFWYFRERKFMEKLVEENKADMIISDNRYGMRSKKVFSVFVTHQLHIHVPAPVKWMEKLVNLVNHRIIRSFDVCLVPDFEQSLGLSGDLGHTRYYGPLLYTGPLSRFALAENIPAAKQMDCLPDDFILVLLSGPEPQRTLLEELLRKHLEDETVVWFRGLPGRTQPIVTNKHVIFDHGSSALMGWCLRNARVVVCRSGYSSIMDLAALGKKALLIPTPGQPEQEYLALHLQQAGFIRTISQNNLEDLKEEIIKTQNCKGLPQPPKGIEVLRESCRELLKRLEQRR